MPDLQIIIKDGRQMIDAPGMDPIPVEDLHQGPQPSWLQRAGTFVKEASPEIVAGLSGVLAPETGGLSLAIPPIAAGATDALKQWSDTGHVNPNQVLLRAGFNLIPGAAGKLGKAAMEGGGGPVMDAAASTMLHGPKGGIVSGLRSMLGLGEAATATTAAPTAAAELAKMTLADGTRVLSSDGLKQLVAKSIALENSNAPAVQVKALDALIHQVRSALMPTNLSAADLLAKVGVPTSTTDAAAAAVAHAAKLAKASRFGKAVNYGLRTAMGMTQGAMGEEP